MSTFSRDKLFPLLVLILLGIGTQLSAHAEPTEYIINNGPSENRVDIVVLGDGYTASEMQKYRTDAQQFLQAFFAQDPYREYQAYFNVIRVDVVSNQSGADHPERGSFVDTALDATYNCAGTQRLVCVNIAKALDVTNRSVAPNQADIKLVIVNDQEYGGSGGLIAVSSVNSLAVEIVLHEVGHSFASLADEYGGTTCGGPDPNRPNITTATTRETIKWNYWIDLSTPIPTTGFTAGVPGLYQGGYYCDQGEFYRPTFNSKMRSLGAPFEQINTEQLVRIIYDLVSPIETSSPGALNLSLQRGQTQMFSITKLVPFTHALNVTWFIDGQAQGTADSFLLDSTALSSGPHTVDVLVRDNTSAVRRDLLELLSETKHWNLTIEASSTPTPTPTPPPSPPVIITQANSNRAIALDSVFFFREPFPKTAPLTWGTEERTRIIIFANNAQLLPGETFAVVTAQMEFGAQVHAMVVEYVGPVAGATGITMIVIKLPDAITTPTDAQVSITVRGIPSNKAVVAVRPP